MSGCKITCYADIDECGYCENGVCKLYDRPCEELHIDMTREDGEE